MESSSIPFFFIIFELYLQDFLMGGKPLSFGELKFPSSQTTLFRVVALKNTEASFVFLARLALSNLLVLAPKPK